MKVKVKKTSYQDIVFLRNLYLQENNFQIRYNACHERNWTDPYHLLIDNTIVGYGSVKGKDNLKDRDTIFEFYIIPPYRDIAKKLFSELVSSSKAIYTECQTNDLFMTSMAYEFSEGVNPEVILFEEHRTTSYFLPEIVFRKRRESDDVFGKNKEDAGEYVLEQHEKIVATGGFLLHYNMPFADLYMEVEGGSRRKGFGQYLIQELKRECYLSGRVPAARCNISNVASRGTLLKGGLKIAGYMVTGKIK